ncbi:MAG: hypothetical protein H7288_05140, partial [Kineosporiaceae bacterium]|nr:hypothetical protein [Aeromicrobium sp.]
MGALTLDASIAKRVDKVGGGGYGLSIWVDGLGRFLERASALRIRTIADQVVSDHRIVQLKPGELGLLVELDEIPDATQWFWDDIEAEISVDPVIDDILAGEISSRDPEAQAEQWATLFDVSVQRIDVP